MLRLIFLWGLLDMSSSVNHLEVQHLNIELDKAVQFLTIGTKIEMRMVLFLALNITISVLLACNDNLLALIQSIISFKGELSSWNNLTVFNCFRVIFSLKKQTIQFSFSFNLYFQQKRAPKLSICHLLTKSSVWVFDVTNRQNGFYNFQHYH